MHASVNCRLDNPQLFVDIEVLTVNAFGEFLQRPRLALTAGVGRFEIGRDSLAKLPEVISCVS